MDTWWTLSALLWWAWCVWDLPDALHFFPCPRFGSWWQRATVILWSDSSTYVRNWCLMWILVNLLYELSVSTFTLLWHHSVCISASSCRACVSPIEQQSHPNETKGAGSSCRLCQRHLQPPGLHLMWTDLHQHEDGGAKQAHSSTRVPGKRWKKQQHP